MKTVQLLGTVKDKIRRTEFAQTDTSPTILDTAPC